MKLDATVFAKVCASIEENPHGWCSQNRAIEIACAVVALKPQFVVVCGVWGGREVIAAAIACRAVNELAQIWAIDPWDPARSIEGLEGTSRDWWQNANHDEVRLSFLDKLNNFGCTENVLVFRQTSDQVAPPMRTGMLMVHGLGLAKTLRDLNKFVPSVEVGGLIFVDGERISSDITVHVVRMGCTIKGHSDGGLWFQKVSPVGIS